MDPIIALQQVEAVWVSRSLEQMAPSVGEPGGFLEFLDLFTRALHRAIETGGPDDVTPAIKEWLAGRTLEEDCSRLASLNHLLIVLSQTASEILGAADAAALVIAVLPAFATASEYVAQSEREQYARQVSQELDETRQALERLEKSKSDFISVAAHELKTPLTLIEGYADMLRELPPRQDIAERTGLLLNGIRTGTLRLREIIEDMIDVSLIDNQMLALNFQPVWLDHLFRMLGVEFESTCQQRRLVFENRGFPGSDEMTFGDAERLLQAFRNLIVNAIKYTPDGGTICVDGRKLPGFFEITIADNGIGIDPKDHKRVFEKFGRLGSTALHSSGKTKFKGGGPGLGLPITKGIIEAHGGAIWIESERYDEVNCPGTTFHILLPQRSELPDDKLVRLFRDAAVGGQTLPSASINQTYEEKRGNLKESLNGKEDC